MRIPILAALSLGLIAAPAVAQNTDEAGSTDIASSVRGLSDTLSDPAMQAQAALMARAMSGVVLEMPVGPLARAAAEIAGDDPDAIDPDMTLRELGGRDADDLPQYLQERVPEMMDRLAGMSGAAEAMVPHLRAMIGQWGDMARSATAD